VKKKEHFIVTFEGYIKMKKNEKLVGDWRLPKNREEGKKKEILRE
jgi:hypothetical protein